MPDPQSQRLYSSNEFAKTIRGMYPELADEQDDDKLTHAVLQVHPEFKDTVVDTLEGSEGAKPPADYLKPPPTALPTAQVSKFGHVAITPPAGAPPPPGSPAPPPEPAGYIGKSPPAEVAENWFAQRERNMGPLLGPAVMTPYRGAVQAAVGLGRLFGIETDPRMVAKTSKGTFDAIQNVADVVSGGLKVGTLALPKAAMAAPLETLAGLMAGGATSEMVQKALTEIGANPSVVQLASDLAGILAGGAVAHGVGAPERAAFEKRSASAAKGAATRSTKRGLESDFATADAAKDASFRQGVEADSDAQSLARAENFAKQIDQIKKLHEQLNRNAALAEWAKQHKASTSGPFDAIDQANKVVGQLPPAPPLISLVGDARPLDPTLQASIDSFSKVPPAVGEPPPTPPQLPEQAGPAGSETRPTFVGANTVPPGTDIVGVPPTTVAASERPFPDLVRSIGEGVSSTLENQPPQPKVRLAPDTEVKVRARLREQAHYKAAFDAARQDLTSQMEDMTHDRGGLRRGREGEYFSPPTAGAPVYWDIVGHTTEHPPSRSYITAIMQTYRDTGAESSKDLPSMGDEKAGELTPMNYLMAGLNVTTEGGARKAYDTWVKEIKTVIDSYARRQMAYEERTRAAPPEAAAAASPAVTEPEMGAGAGAGEVTTGADGTVGAKPPSAAPPLGPVPSPEAEPAAAAPAEIDQAEMPPNWLDLPPPKPKAPPKPKGAPAPAPEAVEPPAGGQPSATFLGYSDPRMEASGQPQPMFNITGGESHGSTVTGLEELAARGVEPPAAESIPSFEDWKANRAGTRGAKAPSHRNLFGEEGYLVLDVRPGDNAGLKKWLKKQEPEYGNQDWHQMATDALEMGEPETAWKLAQIAAARSYYAASGGNAAKNREAEPIQGVEQLKARQAQEIAEIEKSIGEKLPKGTRISSGIAVLPGNPGGLDPKLTDLTMGRVFARSLVDLTDPNTIVRILDEEGKKPSDLPKELQIANQMADQYLRETPDELLQPIMDDLGLTRAQVSAHFARKISDAGRSLGMIGNWVQANEEAFIHLDPDMPSTKGPGAAGRLEFLPEDRQDVIANYMDILRRKGLTNKLAENLKAAGYEAPKGIDPGSKAAQADARSWLRNRQRQITAGKIVDKVAAKYNDPDTVMAAMGDVPPAGRAIEDASQLALATMLSQQATAMKILVSHGIRYGLGAMEEGLAGVAARTRGDFTASAQHFTQAEKMASTPFTQLDYLPKGLLHSPTTDNLESIFEYTRTADPASVHKFLQALDQFPEEKARMTGARLSEGNDPPSTFHRIRNLLTIGIRASMMATRAAVGDSVLRSLIVAKGDSPLEVLGDPSGVIGKYGADEGRNMLGTSVSAALNYTYAGNPLPDSPVGKVLQLMHEVPGLAPAIRTVRPFVRFTMATVPRFIWDRMGGMTLPVDLAMHAIWKTGRLSRGLQLDALQRSGGILEATQTQLAQARFQVSDSLNESMSAMLEARQAKKALDAITQRGESTGALPEAQDHLDQLKEEYSQKTEAANQARAQYLASRQEAKDLEQTYGKSLTRANQLREIDAPNWDQYIARQTTGALLMAVAFGIRGLAQNQGTKYYEHRTDDQSTPVDLRGTLAGFAPYLHTADFFQDVIHHTDWAAIKAGKPMTEAYTGKYQTAETLAQAMDDWFAVSYLTGTSGIVADLLTGRAPEAMSANAPQSLKLMFLEGVGEQLGRFTTGFQTLKDYAGAVNPEEAKSRTPERAGEATPISRILFGPAASHIPFLSETLPEKISPFTGQPIEKAHPGVHQASGLSFSPRLTRAEEEINKVGLAYGKAVPKVTGDQDLDNQVNRAYAAIVQKYLPPIVEAKEYQARTPELNRDVLEQVFHGMKAAAYATVTSQLNQAEAEKLVKSPAQLAKMQRWKDYLERNQKDLAGPPPEPQDDQQAEPEPAPRSQSRVAVGSPPPPA